MAFFKEIQRTEQALFRQHASHHAGEPIIRVRDLSVAYEHSYALDNVSFEVERAARLAVLGPNGAGKSTLLKVIAGLLPQTKGEVEIFGEEPGQHICIAYVPQRSHVDWSFPVRVRDVVMMGRIGKLGLFRRPGRADQEITAHSMEIVNLTALADRQISELSGGQQQRMFIARALAQEAELMLMDEPLTGLDTTSQDGILRILDTLRDQRVTVLVALHDLKLAAERFDGVMLLNHRLIGMGSPDSVFSPENLASAYGGPRVWKPDDLSFMDDACCGDEEHNHA